MPSTVTHALIAESAAALLKGDDRQYALSAPDYYYLGAQGPDLYFFYRPLEGKNNWGKLLHRGAIYRWFEGMLSALASRTGEERRKCLAYILGFCTHLEADSAFHPFVYVYMQEKGLRGMEHQRIENDWDVYFAATMEARDVRGYRFPFDLKKIAREGVLYAFLKDAAALNGRRIEKGPFRRMLFIFRRYCLCFHRKHFRYLLPFLPKLYPKKKPDPEVLRGGTLERVTGLQSADGLFLSAAQHSAERMEELLCTLGLSQNGADAADGTDERPALPPAFSRHLLTGQPVPIE